MMNLSASMDLRDLMDNVLAKAKFGFLSFYPPAKAGGNSNVLCTSMG